MPAVKAILEECCLLVCKVNDGTLAVKLDRPVHAAQAAS